jgi:hypothetical protein
MREGDMQLRLKRFEAKQRALKVAVLETMIRDFDRASVELLEQIAAEEERTRIKDTRHFAYSTFATAAALRRRKLLISAAELKPKLAAAKRELDEATIQLRDLELAQSLTTQSSGPLTLVSPSHVNGVEQR